jgi:peptide/nickel transport system substrate-binding protein
MLSRICRVSGSVAFLALALALAPPAAAQQKVLRVVPHADLKILDPIQTAALITRMHALMVYDTLFAWDANLVAQPMMVERWSVSDDKKKYTFTLREGLKFHDGQPVTTRDVIASLKRWMVRDLTGQKLAEFTAAIEAADARTFTMTMKEPYGFVVHSLGSSGGVIPVIMREKDALTDPHTAVTEAIGSGPFRFVRAEWAPGSRIVYERNPDYQARSEPPSGLAGGRVVRVDRVEYIVIPDANTVAAALEKGEVDFWDTPLIDLVPQLERNRDLVVRKVQPLAWFGFLRPNALFAPFNNAKAREALSLMVDQADYMRAAIGDEKWWKTCYSFFVCDTPFASEAGGDKYRKPDLDAARRLMLESGYKGEKVVVISAPETKAMHSLAEVTMQRLRAIGVNAEMQAADWGTVVSKWNKKDPPEQGGWHIFHAMGSGSTWHNPLTNLGANTNCDGTNWAGWPCDEPAAKLREAFIRAPDAAAQKAAAEALNRRLWEIHPYVLLGQYDQPYVWRKSVEGVLNTGLLVFWNIVKN